MEERKPVDIKSIISLIPAELPQPDHASLQSFLQEITRWNDQIGLVSKPSIADVLTRMVIRSLSLFRFLDRLEGVDLGGPIVDIGSGAGFPGLIWAMLRPDTPITLVERKEKKAAFLERCAVVLRLPAVEVVHADSGELGLRERYTDRYRVAVALALGRPGNIAGDLEALVRPGGVFCTARPHEESVQPHKVGKHMSLMTLHDAAPLDKARYAVYLCQMGNDEELEPRRDV